MTSRKKGMTFLSSQGNPTASCLPFFEQFEHKAMRCDLFAEMCLYAERCQELGIHPGFLSQPNYWYFSVSYRGAIPVFGGPMSLLSISDDQASTANPFKIVRNMGQISFSIPSNEHKHAWHEIAIILWLNHHNCLRSWGSIDGRYAERNDRVTVDSESMVKLEHDADASIKDKEQRLFVEWLRDRSARHAVTDIKSWIKKFFKIEKHPCRIGG